MNVIITALQLRACTLDTLPCLREDDETTNVHDQNLDPLPRALILPKKLRVDGLHDCRGKEKFEDDDLITSLHRNQKVAFN